MGFLAKFNSEQVICQQATMARRFFTLNEMLFFTINSEVFKTFRALNLSSGSISNEYLISSMLTRNNDPFLEAKTIGNDLIWAFMFNVKIKHCHLVANVNLNNYCDRVKQMSQLVVAMLSNRFILFMRYDGKNFGYTIDKNNFLEFRFLIKHLDRYGYINSLTHDPVGDQFITTHSGRHKHICLTLTYFNGDVVVPLPVWDELLNDNLFQTECFQTSEHYNSVINIAGKLYAIHDGGVNQIRINTKRKKVETLNKYTEHEFFNCYHNSSVIYQQKSDPINKVSLNVGSRKHPKKIRMRSMMTENNDTIETTKSSFGFFSIFTIGLIFTLGMFGYLHYSGNIDSYHWIRMLRDSAHNTYNHSIESLPWKVDLFNRYGGQSESIKFSSKKSYTGTNSSQWNKSMKRNGKEEKSSFSETSTVDEPSTSMNIS